MKYLIMMFALLVSGGICIAQSQTEKQMKNSCPEIIRYQIAADKHADFEKAYAEAGKYLKQSPYCLGYQILHGDEEPDNYLVMISWTSKADHLDKFRKSDEFRSFFNLVRPYYNNIQEMKHYVATATQWTRE